MNVKALSTAAAGKMWDKSALNASGNQTRPGRQGCLFIKPIKQLNRHAVFPVLMYFLFKQDAGTGQVLLLKNEKVN